MKQLPLFLSFICMGIAIYTNSTPTAIVGSTLWFSSIILLTLDEKDE